MAAKFDDVIRRMLHLGLADREAAIDAFCAGRSGQQQHMARLVCNQYRRELFATIKALADNRTAESCCCWFAERTPVR